MNGDPLLMPGPDASTADWRAYFEARGYPPTTNHRNWAPPRGRSGSDETARLEALTASLSVPWVRIDPDGGRLFLGDQEVTRDHLRALYTSVGKGLREVSEWERRERGTWPHLHDRCITGRTSDIRRMYVAQADGYDAVWVCRDCR